jgi:hypothetical protein
MTGTLYITTRTISGANSSTVVGYTMSASGPDNTIFHNATGGATYTLYPLQNGIVYKFKDITGFIGASGPTGPAINVVAGGTAKIDGLVAAINFITPYGTLEFTCDGTNWYMTQGQ